MAPRRRSLVWKFFDKTDGAKVKCRICMKTLKSSGNTTNLMGHIKSVHKINNLRTVENMDIKQLHKDSKVSLSNFIDFENCIFDETSSIKPKDEIDNTNVIVEVHRDVEAKSESSFIEFENCIMDDLSNVPLKLSKNNTKVTEQETEPVTKEIVLDVNDYIKRSVVEEDIFDNYGKVVAMKCRSLSKRQWFAAEKIINEALLHAQLGSLKLTHKLCNCGPDHVCKYQFPPGDPKRQLATVIHTEPKKSRLASFFYDSDN